MKFEEECDEMSDGEGEAINSVFGVPFQSLRCRLREHESRGRESPSKTLTSSEPRLDAQVAMQSRTTREHRHTQIDAGSELKNASEILRMEQKGWIEEMR